MPKTFKKSIISMFEFTTSALREGGIFIAFKILMKGGNIDEIKRV
jgi:hypothetical protein